MPRRAASWAIAGLLTLAFAAGAADAATFTVTSTADSGAGSLREAMQMANDSADTANTIEFDLPADSTITLESPLDPISNDRFILDATSSPGLVIEGGRSNAVGQPFLQNTFSDGSTTTRVTLRNVTFADGQASLIPTDLRIDESGNGAMGSVSGAGYELVKLGAGTTTLTAGETIEGLAHDLTIQEGTFVVDGEVIDAAVFVSSQGSLEVNGLLTDNLVELFPQADFVLDGDMVGGSVSLGSSSLFTLNGTATGVDVDLSPQATFDLFGEFSDGSIDVGSLATLRLDGDVLDSSLLIQGMLTGDSSGALGVVGGDVTVSGGTVSPSGSTGLLRVAAPITFESDSVLEVDVLPGNQGDELRVEAAAGVVTVEPGALLRIRATPSDFDAPSSQVVLTSVQPISGTFDHTDFAFLDVVVDQQPNFIEVTLSPSGATFSSLAQTPNQIAVAGTLDALEPGATGDLRDVFDALVDSTEAEVPDLLDAIGGDALTAFATGRQILAERTSRALHRRARDASWGEARAFYAGSRPIPLAPVAGLGISPLGFRTSNPRVSLEATSDSETLPPITPLHRAPRVGAWLDAFGVHGRLDGERGEAEVRSTLFGGTLGVDAWIADQLLVGLAAGYARSDLDPDDRDGDFTGDTIHGALYAGWSGAAGFLSAYGRYAHSFLDSTRRIESSQISRRARADWDAQDYGAGGEAGFTLFSIGKVAFQPVAGVDWLRLEEDDYTESGAGSLALSVQPEDLESVTARFGGRLLGHIDLEGQGELVPELRAFWQREFGDRDRVLRANLAGVALGGAAGIRGPELPRDSLWLGVGWSGLVADNVEILLDYDAVLDTDLSDRVEHQGNLAVRVSF